MNDLRQLFKTSGGWNEGHTAFKNGFHGNGWIEKGFVTRCPQTLNEVTRAQAGLVKQHTPDTELLIGPAINGSIIASHVGRLLQKPFAITTGKAEEIGFHRMYIPTSGSKVVIIEDLIFSGADILSNIKFLKKNGMLVQGIFVWINRQQEKFDGITVHSLLPPPFEYYQADKCPLCKNAVPVKYENIRE